MRKQLNITSTSDGILFEILVKPMSKNCRIAIINNEVTFFSKKPAYKGKANKDLIKVLSHLFRRKVKIVFGFTSNKKIVFIKDLDQGIFKEKIKACEVKDHPS